MALIGTESFSDGVDKYLEIHDDQIFFPYVSGSNWTILRFGFLWSIVPLEFTSSMSPKNVFAIGMTTGTGSGIGSETTTHWVGGVIGDLSYFPGQSVYPMTYRRSASGSYFDAYYLFTEIKNNVVYGNAGFSSGPCIPISSGSVSILRRFPVVFEISRSQATASIYSASFYYLDSTSITSSNTNKLYTEQGLRTGITGSPNIIVNGTTLTKATVGLQNADFTTYPPDTFNVWYQNKAFPVRLYTSVVYKVN